MVLSSVEVCMDSVDWTQSFCTNLCKPVLPPPEEMMPPCPNRPQAPPPLMPERRSKPQPEQALKCPRCDSTNTKFCYYNNYNLSQPRHFCKACRRYWTKGGALRNVPVGGGCRKNKRAKKTATPADAPAITNEASTSAPSATTQDLANCSTTYESTLPVPPPDSLYFTSNSLSLTGIPFTRLTQDTAPPSFLCSEALGTLNPFKTTNPALDFSATMAAADQNSLFQSQPGISRSLASTLFIDTDSDLSWKLQQQQNQQPPKLCFPLEEGGQVNGSEPQDFLTFDQQAAAVDNPSSSDHKSDVLKMLPPCAVKEEPNASLTSDWQVPAPESLFAGDSTSYWNGGGWPDISSFTSITQLL